MKRIRKCNDEIYLLAKYQVLVKKLKNKRFRPFCLCPPDVFKDIKERVFDSKENQRHKRESFWLLFQIYVSLNWNLYFISYIITRCPCLNGCRLLNINFAIKDFSVVTMHGESNT